jgi:hypothetical protein
MKAAFFNSSVGQGERVPIETVYERALRRIEIMEGPATMRRGSRSITFCARVGSRLVSGCSSAFLIRALKSPLDRIHQHRPLELSDDSTDPQANLSGAGGRPEGAPQHRELVVDGACAEARSTTSYRGRTERLEANIRADGKGLSDGRSVRHHFTVKALHWAGCSSC